MPEVALDSVAIEVAVPIGTVEQTPVTVVQAVTFREAVVEVRPAGPTMATRRGSG
jgi:hypothetical protein